jgi:hypothetical protein
MFKLAKLCNKTDMLFIYKEIQKRPLTLRLKRDTNERTWSEFNFGTICWFKLTPGAPKVVMYRVPNDQHFEEV